MKKILMFLFLFAVSSISVHAQYGDWQESPFHKGEKIIQFFQVSGKTDVLALTKKAIYVARRSYDWTKLADLPKGIIPVSATYTPQGVLIVVDNMGKTYYKKMQSQRLF